MSDKTLVETPSATVAPPTMSRSPMVLGWLKGQYAFFILVGLVVIAGFSSKAFLTQGNLTNLSLQLSVTGIVVLAELLVVISGGIDISVGSIVGLGAVLSAGVFSGGNLLVGLILGVAVGAGLGAVNGAFVAFRGINPFIVTLGMLALARGLVYAYTEGSPLSPNSGSFISFGSATIAGVPVLTICWLIAAAAIAFILYRTVFGRRIYAVGSNPRAAYSSGVSVRSTLFTVYVMAGALAGLAGVLLTCRIGAGTPTAGTNYELDAIAAVVIGGASLAGGYGKVFGAIVGTVIFGVITNLLVLLNVSTFYQDAFKGALILLAVLLATVGRKQQN